MAKTRRSEMKGFVAESSPKSGESAVAYAYGPTDGFTQNVLSQKHLEDQVTATNRNRTLSGDVLMNDDYYRRTVVTSSISTQNDSNISRPVNLSLARTVESKAEHEAVIRLVARVKRSESGTSSKAKAIAPLVNVIPPYTKFFLESVSEDYMEKAQVVETFGRFVAFFFGDRPQVSRFSGQLLNMKNHDWKNDFQQVYENFLRGTKAVENNAVVYIQYDDVMAEGYLINNHMEYHSVSNNACPFSFSMLVTNRAPIYQSQRLQARRLRTGLSAAEQQLLDDVYQIQSQALPFSIMQKALSTTGLTPSDIVIYTAKNNKVAQSDVSDFNIASSEIDELFEG